VEIQEMKKISVVIPVYNGRRHIRRCLNSIRNQAGRGDLFHLEIIAVDDHSTDGTWEFLKDEKDIVLIRTSKPSGGPNAGRNLGLDAASGDYIALTDQDDEWVPDKLKVQLKLAEMVPIVYSNFQIIDSSTGRVDLFGEISDRIVFDEHNEIFLRFLKCDYSTTKPLPLMSTLFFKESLRRVRFEEHFGYCDLDYALKLTHNRKSARICKPLVIRHVDGRNLSLDISYRQTVFYYNQLVLAQHEDRYPRETSIGIRSVFGTYARYYYKLGEMKKARKYFIHGKRNWKTLAYWITSFIGYQWVKNKFRIFGT
jgi:glycosyltransferase involved in cell wall biosynthesis